MNVNNNSQVYAMYSVQVGCDATEGFDLSARRNNEVAVQNKFVLLVAVLILAFLACGGIAILFKSLSWAIGSVASLVGALMSIKAASSRSSELSKIRAQISKSQNCYEEYRVLLKKFAMLADTHEYIVENLTQDELREMSDRLLRSWAEKVRAEQAAGRSGLSEKESFKHAHLVCCQLGLAKADWGFYF